MYNRSRKGVKAYHGVNVGGVGEKIYDDASFFCFVFPPPQCSAMMLQKT